MVRVWDTSSHTQSSLLEHDSFRARCVVTAVATDPRGGLLATASRGVGSAAQSVTLHLWDLKSRKRLCEVPCSNGPARSSNEAGGGGDAGSRFWSGAGPQQAQGSGVPGQPTASRAVPATREAPDAVSALAFDMIHGTPQEAVACWWDGTLVWCRWVLVCAWIHFNF